MIWAISYLPLGLVRWLVRFFLLFFKSKCKGDERGQ